MSVFDRLGTAYDLGMRPLEWLVLRGLRRRAFTSAKGRILEMGVGTGVNLPLYGRGVRLVALDASGPMLRRAARRPTQATARFVQADVHHLPFPDGCFDVVTGSLLFCSVRRPARALEEVRRLLRRPEPEAGAPGGRLVLVEHTRGEGLGRWLTDAFHPLWRAFSRECHLNRETTKAVTDAGFRLLRLETRLLGIFRVIEGERSLTWRS
jgi:ubiquinone/menaquinone biosynthesis C-methylase UbiE